MEAPRQLLAARGCRCGCLECMSHAGKIKSRLSSPSSCLHSQPWVLAFGASWCKGLVLANHGVQSPPFLPHRSPANLGLLSSQTKRGLLRCSVQ